MPHVHAAMKSWTSETSVGAVRDVAASQVHELINRLREFERKYDCR